MTTGNIQLIDWNLNIHKTVRNESAMPDLSLDEFDEFLFESDDEAVQTTIKDWNDVDSFYDSPSGPIDELRAVMDLENMGSMPMLFESFADEDSVQTVPFDKRIEVTALSLAQSMQRSQETRRFLTFKTMETQNYPRKCSVLGVIESVQKSAEQLQVYLPTHGYS